MIMFTTRISGAIALLAGLGAAAVLLGHVMHLPVLTNISPNLQGMSAVTAIGVLIFAMSILAEVSGRRSLAAGAALIPLAIGLTVLACHVTAGRDLISPALSRILFGYDDATSGRTSPATALCLLLLGVAGQFRGNALKADIAAAATLIVAGIAVLGYWYGVRDLYALPAFGTIALHTALMLFALSIASLMVRPESGAAAVIVSTEEGGGATRRQLAFTLVPPVIAFVLLRATDAERLGPAAAMAILVVLTVAPLAILILRDGQRLNALSAERRTKLEQQRSSAELLEARLAEQAARLQQEALLQRERQAALDESRDFTRLALSAVGGVGAWTYDVATDRFKTDAAIAELYGLDVDEATGGISRERFLINVHHEDRQALTSTMSGGLRKSGDLELEYRIVHPDGSVRWVLSRGNTYHGEDGRPVRRTGVGIDVTRQRLLEEQLRQSQKLEVIGQLTGGVAHDFNNLLTVIRSSLEMLQRPGLTEERRARFLDAISDTTDRAAKLTRQLLAFARRQALQPEVFDVSASIEKIGDMVVTLTGSRIRIATHLATEATLVHADPSQFDTAMVNLAVNARDAMDGEGNLTISVTLADAIPATRSQPAVPGRFVAIAIGDTGRGIPAADLDRIFEPFFTTKGIGHGTGLGLSQVFGFVRQSGGEVTVDSVVGEGTHFTLFLPQTDRELVLPQDVAEPLSLADGHDTRILLVEDNDEVGESSLQALTELGYRPVLAPDAEHALAVLGEAPSFDVVFSDVVMPGMDGIELGQRIRALHADLPVVLTSGYSHVLAENGTHGFELLQKPYSIQELSVVLQKAVAWRRSLRRSAGWSEK